MGFPQIVAPVVNKVLTFGFLNTIRVACDYLTARFERYHTSAGTHNHERMHMTGASACGSVVCDGTSAPSKGSVEYNFASVSRTGVGTYRASYTNSVSTPYTVLASMEISSTFYQVLQSTVSSTYVDFVILDSTGAAADPALGDGTIHFGVFRGI